MRAACLRLSLLLGAMCCILTASPERPASAGGLRGAPAVAARNLKVERGISLALQQIAAASQALAQGNPRGLAAGLLAARGQIQQALGGLGMAAPETVRASLLAVEADLLPEELAADPVLASHLLERAAADLANALRLFRSGEATLASASRVTAQPTPVDFGEVCVGEMRALEIMITNKTSVARALTLRANAEAPFSLAPGSPTTVAAGETVTLTVQFQPHRLGRFRRSVFLSATAPGNRDAGIYLPFDGSGIFFTQDPSPLDFGDVIVDSTRTLPLTLTNCLNQPVSVTLSPGASFFPAAGQERTVTFGARESKQIQVTFSPVFPGEFRTGFGLKARVSGRMRSIGTVHCRGVGKEPVKVGARLIDFGAVATNQFHTRSLAIENNTDQPQEVEIDASKFHAEFWRVQPQGKVVLAPNSTTNVNFRFGAVGRCKHQANLIVKHPSFRRGKFSTLVKVRTR